MNRDKFVCNLNKYYENLLNRLDNGTKYLNGMRGEIYNTKEYVAYEDIIKELSEVERLIMYYKRIEN